MQALWQVRIMSVLSIKERNKSQNWIKHFTYILNIPSFIIEKFKLKCFSMPSVTTWMFCTKYVHHPLHCTRNAQFLPFFVCDFSSSLWNFLKLIIENSPKNEYRFVFACVYLYMCQCACVFFYICMICTCQYWCSKQTISVKRDTVCCEWNFQFPRAKTWSKRTNSKCMRYVICMFTCAHRNLCAHACTRSDIFRYACQYYIVGNAFFKYISLF